MENTIQIKVEKDGMWWRAKSLHFSSYNKSKQSDTIQALSDFLKINKLENKPFKWR